MVGHRLALESATRDVLKDVSKTSMIPYDDTWTHLAYRFGYTDSARDARRLFDSCRQTDQMSIQEFEQTLGVLHRDAWPERPAEQRDAKFNISFEEGLINSGMAT